MSRFAIHVDVHSRSSIEKTRFSLVSFTPGTSIWFIQVNPWEYKWPTLEYIIVDNISKKAIAHTSAFIDPKTNDLYITDDLPYEPVNQITLFKEPRDLPQEIVDFIEKETICHS